MYRSMQHTSKEHSLWWCYLVVAVEVGVDTMWIGWDCNIRRQLENRQAPEHSHLQRTHLPVSACPRIRLTGGCLPC